MKELEDRIRAFSEDTGNIEEAIALIAIGRRENDQVDDIFANVIANVLLKFHGIPITKSNQN